MNDYPERNSDPMHMVQIVQTYGMYLLHMQAQGCTFTLGKALCKKQGVVV